MPFRHMPSTGSRKTTRQACSMAVTPIFAHDNATEDTPTARIGNASMNTAGMCSAYSIDWAKRFLEGKELKDTQPSLASARALTLDQLENMIVGIPEEFTNALQAHVHGLRVADQVECH